MPLYQFINDKTGEIKDILMSMNDKHQYIDETGYQWRRLWINPQVAIDTAINPFSAKEFNQKSSNKNYTVGDLWDKSKEASIKRQDKEGYDKIKSNFFENYKKKRKGKRHPDDPSRVKDYTIG